MSWPPRVGKTRKALEAWEYNRMRTETLSNMRKPVRFQVVRTNLYCKSEESEDDEYATTRPFCGRDRRTLGSRVVWLCEHRNVVSSKTHQDKHAKVSQSQRYRNCSDPCLNNSGGQCLRQRRQLSLLCKSFDRILSRDPIGGPSLGTASAYR